MRITLVIIEFVLKLLKVLVSFQIRKVEKVNIKYVYMSTYFE